MSHCPRSLDGCPRHPKEAGGCPPLLQQPPRQPTHPGPEPGDLGSDYILFFFKLVTRSEVQ